MKNCNRLSSFNQYTAVAEADVGAIFTWISSLERGEIFPGIFAQISGGKKKMEKGKTKKKGFLLVPWHMKKFFFFLSFFILSQLISVAKHLPFVFVDVRHINHNQKERQNKSPSSSWQFHLCFVAWKKEFFLKSPELKNNINDTWVNTRSETLDEKLPKTCGNKFSSKVKVFLLPTHSKGKN